eukprot:10660068-Lingulodinium_polyedra.AAC.1
MANVTVEHDAPFLSRGAAEYPVELNRFLVRCLVTAAARRTPPVAPSPQPAPRMERVGALGNCLVRAAAPHGSPDPLGPMRVERPTNLRA